MAEYAVNHTEATHGIYSQRAPSRENGGDCGHQKKQHRCGPEQNVTSPLSEALHFLRIFRLDWRTWVDRRNVWPASWRSGMSR